MHNEEVTLWVDALLMHLSLLISASQQCQKLITNCIKTQACGKAVTTHLSHIIVQLELKSRQFYCRAFRHEWIASQ